MIDTNDDSIFNRKTLLIIMLLFGALVGTVVVNNFRRNLIRTKDNPRLVVTGSISDPTALVYSEYPGKEFYDRKPFGSLDYVMENYVSRKPTTEDYETFTRLEKEAREKGMLKD
ncbi:hypothetical protein KY335_04870 [Candidatus Woesearchaeota archaeon]|nr:hypothetical protein [Candidatus Woesearchaeota archaeon]